MIRKFSKEFMQAVLWEDEPGTKIIRDTIVENSRWSIHHELIFSFEEKLWMTYYSIGATECQDERPFEYDEEVECDEVKEVTKTVVDYVPVK